MEVDENKAEFITTNKAFPVTEGMVIAETERLIIRVLRLVDAELILDLLNEPAFIENIGDKGVRNINDARDYITKGPLAMQNLLGFSLYCCQRKSDGKTIGLSGLIKREGIEYPEVGCAFLETYRRQGYGLESASAVMVYARDNLQVKTLQAITNTDNQASIDLLERLGFYFKNLVQLPINEDKVNLFELDFE